MTEGIIQQTFKDYMKVLSIHENNLMFKRLQEILIEKIKQTFKTSYDFTSDKIMIRTLEITLIGDNEE